MSSTPEQLLESLARLELQQAVRLAGWRPTPEAWDDIARKQAVVLWHETGEWTAGGMQ